MNLGKPNDRADLSVRLPSSISPHLPVRPGGTSVPASRRHWLSDVVKLAAIVLSGGKIGLAADRKTTGKRPVFPALRPQPLASWRFDSKKFNFQSSPVISGNLWSSQLELFREMVPRKLSRLNRNSELQARATMVGSSQRDDPAQCTNPCPSVLIRGCKSLQTGKRPILSSAHVRSKTNPGKQGLFRSRNGQVFEPKEADSHAAHQKGMTKTTKRDKTRHASSKSVLIRAHPWLAVTSVAS
jgi:hypothetical protein